MPLPKDYLDYPQRRHGMDQDAYTWQAMRTRAPERWSTGANLALWINISLQHFPLDALGKPFKAPGAMQTPYPDLRHYSLREHGNRVGVFRVIEALRSRGLKASFAINGVLAERYPRLLELVAAAGGEWLGHGWDMDQLPHAGWSLQQEQAWVERSLTALRVMAPRPITGWLSPARQQSPHTAGCLRSAGLGFMADWVNDELPFRYQTNAGPLTVLPLSSELEDRFVMLANLHGERSWCEQVCDAFDFLAQESQVHGARILALSLHPWVIGHAHRIAQLERALDHMLARSSLSAGGDSGPFALWNALPCELTAEFRQHETQDVVARTG